MIRKPVIDIMVQEITVFFPFYNEEDHIERVTIEAAEVLERLGIDYEIILVDDGSTDRTPQLADRLAKKNARINAIHHSTNRGYGATLQSGFRSARKEWVFYTDGDGQFDISQLGILLPLADHYDILHGYRENRQDGLIRKLNAYCWGWLVTRLLRFQVRDVNSAFKLCRREIFDHIELKSSGALICAELFARAIHAGYTVGQIRVSHLPRTAGRQAGSSPKVILRAFKELFQLRKEIVAVTKVKGKTAGKV